MGHCSRFIVRYHIKNKEQVLYEVTGKKIAWVSKG